MEIAEYESILAPARKHNYVKAQCLTALSMYAALGYPWTTGSDLRATLAMPHSTLTLLARWVGFKYIQRRGESGYYEYRIAPKGRAWLESLSDWWPEYRRGIPIEADQRLAAIDGLRRSVAMKSRITVWWGQYGGGQVWNLHSIKGPFLLAADYQYHRPRISMDELSVLFDTNYLAEVTDAMAAMAFISDKLGMAPGRGMVEAMVTGGQLEWSE